MILRKTETIFNICYLAKYFGIDHGIFSTNPENVILNRLLDVRGRVSDSVI
jgi:hypothetical protein